MRRRFSFLCLLSAWFLASGSQWDLLQTFAWVRMAVNYKTRYSLTESLELTFDADKPCKLCRAVSKAKQQEASGELPTEAVAAQKIALICQPAVLVIGRPAMIGVCVAGQTPSPGTLRHEPPVPPPRALI